jgi:hypothetical protein
VTVRERIELGTGVLNTSDLEALGWSRRASEALFQDVVRHGGTIKIPGFGRELIRVEDYLAALERCRFRDDRVA